MKYTNKLLTKRFATQILIAGICLWVITQMITYVVLWNVYGLADKASTTTDIDHTVGTWHSVATVASIVRVVAYVIIALGLVDLVIVKHKQKQK